MYKVVQKMKAVKKELIEWAKNKGLLNTSDLCHEAKENLKAIQSKLEPDPMNISLA